MLYPWLIGLLLGVICLIALGRVVGIARRAIAHKRRWTLWDCFAEYVASWFIVLFITAAAVTGFFVVYYLAWRLTFEIPAENWLRLAGVVLGIWVAGWMGHVTSRLLWSGDSRLRQRKPVCLMPPEAPSAASGCDLHGNVTLRDPSPIKVLQDAEQTESLSPPRQRFQFTLPFLLLSVAIVAVAVRLSTVSWAAVTLFVALVASLVRTRQVVHAYQRALGQPVTARQWAAAFGSSLIVVAAILAVGLGIFSFAQISLGLLFRGWDLWLLHLAPAILAMFCLGRSLWPVKSAGSRRKANGSKRA
jgi:hypothetical protein